MVRPKPMHLLLTALVLFCGVLIYLFFFAGKEMPINTQIELLRNTVAKHPDETELTAGLRSRKIRRLFTDTCRIEAAVYDVSKTYRFDEIGPSIMAARTPYSRIDIDIYDLNITEIRENQAGVRFTASLDLMPYAGPSMTDTHEIECRLEKNDDGWLFSEIRIIDVLER